MIILGLRSRIHSKASSTSSAPDYLIKLTNGITLVLEVKGMDDQQNQTKRVFLAEWVQAVNAHGGFGRWAADVSRHPKDVLEILERHNNAYGREDLRVRSEETGHAQRR
jgi:type III restriction enzyme